MATRTARPGRSLTTIKTAMRTQALLAYKALRRLEAPVQIEISVHTQKDRGWQVIVQPDLEGGYELVQSRFIEGRESLRDIPRKWFQTKREQL
jgi:hypothetical protein